MRSLSFLSVLVLILVGFTLCGCRKGSTKFSQSEMQPTDQISSEKDVMLDSLYGPHDVYMPPHDDELDKRIRKAVADIVDTNKIYQIYQYADHHVVHILDRGDQTKTGIVYVTEDLTELNYVTLVGANPYSCDFPSDTTYLGFPIYDVRGVSKEEIKSKISKIRWDNSGEPSHIYTRSVVSEFAPTYMVRGYCFNVLGAKGPMAVQSKIYVEDKKGNYIDSIELIGYEMWHPSITDDGRFLAYEYGRAYPEEGGGQETAHFTIYDIENKVHIYEIKDFTKYGNSIFSNGNFICHSKYDPNDKYKRRYYYWYPHERVIYVVPVVNQEGKPWGRFTEKGVLNRNNPNELIKRWTEFETITFEEYKN